MSYMQRIDDSQTPEDKDKIYGEGLQTYVRSMLTIARTVEEDFPI